MPTSGQREKCESQAETQRADARFRNMNDRINQGRRVATALSALSHDRRSRQQDWTWLGNHSSKAARTTTTSTETTAGSGTSSAAGCPTGTGSSAATRRHQEVATSGSKIELRYGAAREPTATTTAARTTTAERSKQTGRRGV